MPGSLNDDTKILTETDTETFFPYQIFQNRNRDFFSDNKFSETETETYFRDEIFPKPILFCKTKFSKTETKTFFWDQIFPKPKQRLFFQDQIVLNLNSEKFGKSLETET